MIYYLSLGSNQGDKNSNINKAIDFLQGIGDIEEVSSLYETEPVGMVPGTENFYNLVLCMQRVSA
jgi:2-amino-4-hydroxy-6-hydroxymethyldihydropteridine diphosphokinase